GVVGRGAGTVPAFGANKEWGVGGVVVAQEGFAAPLLSNFPPPKNRPPTRGRPRRSAALHRGLRAYPARGRSRLAWARRAARLGRPPGPRAALVIAARCGHVLAKISPGEKQDPMANEPLIGGAGQGGAGGAQPVQVVDAAHF